MSTLTLPKRLSLALCAALLYGSVPRVAHASAVFPIVIQSELGLMNPPPCTLCHRNDLGGIGTVTRPFGRTLVDRFGLTSSNVSTLKAALAGSDAEHLDSDGDGAPDIDELRADTDPNVGMSGEDTTSSVPLPETGCMLTRAHHRDGEDALPLIALGLGFARWRLRRVRRGLDLRRG